MYKMNRTRVSDAAMCKYFISANGNSRGGGKGGGVTRRKFLSANSSTGRRAISVDPSVQSESYLYFNSILDRAQLFPHFENFQRDERRVLSLPSFL